jgi:hypothetical protein
LDTLPESSERKNSATQRSAKLRSRGYTLVCGRLAIQASPRQFEISPQ